MQFFFSWKFQDSFKGLLRYSVSLKKEEIFITYMIFVYVYKWSHWRRWERCKIMDSKIYKNLSKA